MAQLILETWIVIGMHVFVYYSLLRHFVEFHANIWHRTRIGQNLPFRLKVSLRDEFQSRHLQFSRDLRLGSPRLNARLHIVFGPNEMERNEFDAIISEYGDYLGLVIWIEIRLCDL